ncbi:MAG: hypothetical protein M1831_000790 [Alyxoria varia]|nr:MAG: hypothetical protein M1831_000790 [Alyxoria varia]
MAIRDLCGEHKKPCLMSLPNEVRDHIWKCYIEASILSPQREDIDFPQSYMNVFKLSINGNPTPAQAIRIEDAILHIAPLQHSSRVVQQEVHNVLVTQFKIQGLTYFHYCPWAPENLHEIETTDFTASLVILNAELFSQVRHIQFQFIGSAFNISRWKGYLECVRRRMPHLQSVVVYCQGSSGRGRIINPQLKHVRDLLDVFQDWERVKVWGRKNGTPTKSARARGGFEPPIDYGICRDLSRPW